MILKLKNKISDKTRDALVDYLNGNMNWNQTYNLHYRIKDDKIIIAKNRWSNSQGKEIKKALDYFNLEIESSDPSKPNVGLVESDMTIAKKFLEKHIVNEGKKEEIADLKRKMEKDKKFVNGTIINPNDDDTYRRVRNARERYFKNKKKLDDLMKKKDESIGIKESKINEDKTFKVIWFEGPMKTSETADAPSEEKAITQVVFRVMDRDNEMYFDHKKYSPSQAKLLSSLMLKSFKTNDSKVAVEIDESKINESTLARKFDDMWFEIQSGEDFKEFVKLLASSIDDWEEIDSDNLYVEEVKKAVKSLLLASKKVKFMGESKLNQANLAYAGVQKSVKDLDFKITIPVYIDEIEMKKYIDRDTDQPSKFKQFDVSYDRKEMSKEIEDILLKEISKLILSNFKKELVDTDTQGLEPVGNWQSINFVKSFDTTY